MANSKTIVTIDCDVCEARVAASLEGSYDIYVDAAEYSLRYLLLKCPECETALLAQQDDQDTSFGRDEDASRWGNLVRLYPHAHGRKLGAAVPEAINKAFSEAYACWKTRAYAACAAMCMKALDGICKAQGAKGGNLAASLMELSHSGGLDRRLADWAVALGVEHDAQMNMSRDRASDLLDLAEAIAEYVYTFKEKLQAFERRHGRIRNSARRNPPVLALVST